MTDTAQPYPNEQADEDPSVLSPYQSRRAVALGVARDALGSKAGLFATSRVGEGFGVDDLLTVADWVLGNPDAELMKPLPAVHQARSEKAVTGAVTEAGWWKPLDPAEPGKADELTSLPAYVEEGEPTEVLPSIPDLSEDYERGTPQ